MTRQSVMRSLAAFLAVTPSLAAAWSADGHRIISQIAEQELAPEARAAVERILGGRSMAEVSAWADEVRAQEEYRWSAPLHYVNIERGAAGYDTARDCPAEGCAVSAAQDMVALLRDPATPAAKQEEALKFLIHIVGDVHQPLHVSLASDRGGNLIQVEAGGIPMNLHTFWDVGSIQAAGGEWPALAEEIFAGITPEQRGAWSSLDPAVWANESYQLAVSVAYAVPVDGKLDPAYIDRAAAIARVRLATAGERLAAVLNSIYVTAAPVAEPETPATPATATPKASE